MSTDRPPRKFTITCSGGTGASTQTNIGGKVEDIGIEAPAASTVYDIELTDEDGFGLGGEVGITGNATLSINKDIWASIIITISNSTSASGTFTLKLWFSQAY